MLPSGCLRTVVLALLVAAPLTAENPPPAPEGFVWKKLDSIRAAFLMPKGWFFKEENHDGTRAFFISKESIEKGGEFSTGLTINVQKVQDGSASDRAMKALAQLAQVGEVQKLWEAENGVLKLYGARIHVTVDPPAFTEHLLTIGNSQTNTLYLIIFESPDSQWDDAWEKGEVMLKDFLLDDEI